MKVTPELVKEGEKCPLLIEHSFEFLMALLQLCSHPLCSSLSDHVSVVQMLAENPCQVLPVDELKKPSCYIHTHTHLFAQPVCCWRNRRVMQSIPGVLFDQLLPNNRKHLQSSPSAILLKEPLEHLR